MVTFTRNQVVSLLRNGWSLCSGFRWSLSPVFPINPTYNYNWSRNKTTIEETILFYFESINSPFSITDFDKYYKKLIRFFIFIQTIIPNDLLIRAWNDEIVYYYAKSKSTVTLELYQEPLNIEPIGMYYNVFFEYEDIKDSFIELVKNWYVRDIQSSIDLLLARAFVPKINPENHFLNICFALESFHRQFINNKTMSDEEFDLRINTIKDNINDPIIKNWLLEKIEFGIEPSFRQRLKALSTFFSSFYDGNVNKLINKIVQTRNYLVHRGKKNKNVITSGIGLFFLTRYIEIVLKINVLDVIGVHHEIFKNQLGFLKSELTELEKRNKS